MNSTARAFCMDIETGMIVYIWPAHCSHLLYIAVAYWRMFLFCLNDSVDDGIQKRLGPAISQVQDPVAAETVVDGKTHSNKRDVPSLGKVIAFAVTYDQIRFQCLSFFCDVVKIDTFTNFRWLRTATSSAITATVSMIV